MLERVKAERRQRRLEKRRAKEMPLFVAAGIADAIQPIPSVAEIEDENRRRAALVRAADLRRVQDNLRSWLRHKALCSQYISTAEVNRLEAYARHTYPGGCWEYRADMWNNLNKALGIRCSCESCQRWWHARDMGLIEPEAPPVAGAVPLARGW